VISGIAAKHEMRKTSMNKGIWIILAVTAIVALFLFIYYFGALAFIVLSLIGFAVWLLIDQANKRKKRRKREQENPNNLIS
jgi:chromate transport protein ChrA